MRPWRLVALLPLWTGPLTAQGKAPHPDPSVPRGQPAPKGTIAVGQTVRDALTRRDPLLPTDSTYAQQWRLGATRAGETVTIDLESDVFDAYVFLLGPGLERERPQDDDSGGSCNARLTARLPQTGDSLPTRPPSPPGRRAGVGRRHEPGSAVRRVARRARRARDARHLEPAGRGSARAGAPGGRTHDRAGRSRQRGRGPHGSGRRATRRARRICEADSAGGGGALPLAAD